MTINYKAYRDENGEIQIVQEGTESDLNRSGINDVIVIPGLNQVTSDDGTLTETLPAVHTHVSADITDLEETIAAAVPTPVQTGIFVISEHVAPANGINIPQTAAGARVETGFDLTAATGRTLKLLFRDTAGSNAGWQTAEIDVDYLLSVAANGITDYLIHIFDNDFLVVNVVDAALGQLDIRGSGRDLTYVRSELLGRIPTTLPITDLQTGAFVFGEHVGDVDIPQNTVGVLVDTGYDLTASTGRTIKMLFRDTPGTATGWQPVEIDVDYMLSIADNGTIDYRLTLFDNDFVVIDVVDAALGQLNIRGSGRDFTYVKSEFLGKALMSTTSIVALQSQQDTQSTAIATNLAATVANAAVTVTNSASITDLNSGQITQDAAIAQNSTDLDTHEANQDNPHVTSLFNLLGSETTSFNAPDSHFTIRSNAAGDGFTLFQQFEASSLSAGPMLHQTTDFFNYHTFSPDLPVDGNYIIFLSYRWSYNAANTNFFARLEKDGDLFLQSSIEPADSFGTGIVVPRTSGGTFNTGTDVNQTTSGFKIFNGLTAGIHNFTLQFAGQAIDQEATIYESEMFIKRLAE